MPIPVICPNCQKRGLIDGEMLGKKIRCPKCQHQFLSRRAPIRTACVPQAIAAIPVNDEYDVEGMTVPLVPLRRRQSVSTSPLDQTPPPYSGSQIAAAGFGCLCALVLVFVVAVFLQMPLVSRSLDESAPTRTTEERVSPATESVPLRTSYPDRISVGSADPEVSRKRVTPAISQFVFLDDNLKLKKEFAD